MAKSGALGVPGWVWGAAIVAAVAWISYEQLKDPRCKKCGVALQVIAAGSKYLCPQCGAVATAAEIVFGLA